MWAGSHNREPTLRAPSLLYQTAAASRGQVSANRRGVEDFPPRRSDKGGRHLGPTGGTTLRGSWGDRGECKGRNQSSEDRRGMGRRTCFLSPDGWVTSASTVPHVGGSMAYWRSRHSPCRATPSSGQLEAGILSFGRHALGVDAEMELQGNAGRHRRSRVSRTRGGRIVTAGGGLGTTMS